MDYDVWFLTVFVLQTEMSTSCRYSNGDLWLAATMGLGTGILIGSFASPEPPSVLKTIRKRIFSVVGLGDFLDKMFSSKGELWNCGVVLLESFIVE